VQNKTYLYHKCNLLNLCVRLYDTTILLQKPTELASTFSMAEPVAVMMRQGVAFSMAEPVAVMMRRGEEEDEEGAAAATSPIYIFPPSSSSFAACPVNDNPPFYMFFLLKNISICTKLHKSKKYFH
jgi:hypothetical protein